MAQGLLAKLALKITVMQDNGVDIAVRTLARSIPSVRPIREHQVFNRKGDRPLSEALTLEQLDTWLAAFATGIAEQRNIQQVEFGDKWIEFAVEVLKAEWSGRFQPIDTCRVCERGR